MTAATTATVIATAVTTAAIAASALQRSTLFPSAAPACGTSDALYPTLFCFYDICHRSAENGNQHRNQNCVLHGKLLSKSFFVRGANPPRNLSYLLRPLFCCLFLCQFLIGLSNHCHHNRYKCRNGNHSRYKALTKATGSKQGTELEYQTTNRKSYS